MSFEVEYVTLTVGLKENKRLETKANTAHILFTLSAILFGYISGSLFYILFWSCVFFFVYLIILVVAVGSMISLAGDVAAIEHCLTHPKATGPS